MADLSTTYMGLELKNPIIAGASALTANMDSIKRLADAGVGAVVTKSLFEEEIQLERFKYEEDIEKDNYRHPEMITVHPHMDFAGPEEHLMWVRETCKALDIPVIASLNAVNRETWIEYAQKLEATGVAGLECNLFASPSDPGRSGAVIEREQVAMVAELKRSVSIPVSLKLSCFYANPLHVIGEFAKVGADAFVLFNRLFEPDLDVTDEAHIYPFSLSYETDYRLALRYAGLLEGYIDADVCASGGIFSGETIVKMMLAGAASVQTVSAVYANGYNHVGAMLQQIEDWMTDKGYTNLGEFRGKLSKRHSPDPWAYTRAQYARLLMNPKEIIENYPTL